MSDDRINLVSHILYCGVPQMVACDANCHKAWGMMCRPKRDGAYIPDAELPWAPADPGTYEGGDGKPRPFPPESHNRWCVRECERSVMVELTHHVTLPTFA